jgi:hypothetical protein
VDALKKQGAVAIAGAELKKLLVEKSVWLENKVTGEKWEIVYGASGKTAAGKPPLPVEPGYVSGKFGENQAELKIRFVGKRATLPSLTGDVATASYLGNSQRYFINDGKIVTSLVGTPIEITVYKMGGKYYGARSNEFGYANYEVIAAQPEVSPLAAGAKPLK